MINKLLFFKKMLIALAVALVLLGAVGFYLPQNYSFNVWVKLRLVDHPKARLIWTRDASYLPTDIEHNLGIPAIVVENRQIIATVGREPLLTPYGLEGRQFDDEMRRYGQADWQALGIMDNIKRLSTACLVIVLPLLAMRFLRRSSIDRASASSNESKATPSD